MAKTKVSKAKKTSKPRQLSAEAMAYLPYPDFPLSPHLPTNRWYKKMNGKRFYYGPLNDPDAALEAYEKYRDDDRRGRKRRDDADTYTMRQLVNEYLTAQQAKRDNDEIKPRTFDEYFKTCDRIIQAFGKTRSVADLDADDFGELRAELAKEYSITRLGIIIQQTRTVFNWAYDNHKIAAPIRYGSSFKKPSARMLRVERNSRPVKMFQPAEIHKLMDKASDPVKAMILLAINCGLGNHDIAALPLSALDLTRKRLDFPRPKTGVQRRCPLWPETVKALRAVVESRPMPNDEADADLVFITKYGRPWTRYHDGDKPGEGVPVDGVSRAFSKLKKAAKVNTTGRGFYALRHTTQSIGSRANDKVALKLIMGHETGDIDEDYQEWEDDAYTYDRLKAVTDHVRGWLYAKPAKRTKKRATK